MGYLDQMNVKANEQDTVGTDYDLRDKDLNAAADTTSVASTQSIVLKGTDGSYHKIDKQSFTEAVRGVLGGILNNMTSKGTAVKGVGVIDNSNDFGLTTPSDLATVLGDVVDLDFTVPGNGSVDNIYLHGLMAMYVVSEPNNPLIIATVAMTSGITIIALNDMWWKQYITFLHTSANKFTISCSRANGFNFNIRYL